MEFHSDARIKRVLTMKKAGFTFTEIASMIGLTKGAVAGICFRHGEKK